jgi:soluble lytic murein transglycosylase-like protein
MTKLGPSLFWFALPFFDSILKNALAYYNAGVVNSKVVGLVPGFRLLVQGKTHRNLRSYPRRRMFEKR